jgi:hypothetical protein
MERDDASGEHDYDGRPPPKPPWPEPIAGADRDRAARVGRHIRSLRLPPGRARPDRRPALINVTSPLALSVEAGGHPEPSAPPGTPRADDRGGWRRARSRCSHSAGSTAAGIATARDRDGWPRFAIDHVRGVLEFRAGRASRVHPARRPLVAPTPAPCQAAPPALPERIEGPVPAEDSSVARPRREPTVVITASLVRQGRAQPAECVLIRCLIRAGC